MSVTIDPSGDAKKLMSDTQVAFKGFGVYSAKNPFFAQASNDQAFDHDQVRACFRYIRAQQNDANKGGNGCLALLKRLDVIALGKAAAQKHSKARANFADQDAPSYTADLKEIGPYDNDYIVFNEMVNKHSGAFLMQLHFECEMYGLNAHVFKGCLLGWTCLKAEGEGYNPFFIRNVSRFLQYHGRPYFPPNSASMDFINHDFKYASAKRRGKRRRRY
jgi:hypothetical protein